jgi:ubiquinone/menaquinone biosynthesis C-methylase UbiE
MRTLDLKLGSNVKVRSMEPSSPTVANHHAHHPGFKGPSGLLAALSIARHTDRDALVVRLAGLTPDDRVVDLGCGPGGAVRAAAREGATVVGIDPAPVMLRCARLLTRGAKARRSRYVQGGAEAIPLPDADATVVWAIATVHHWPEVEGAIDEIRRVLRPGGRLLAMERRSRAGATGLASHGWTDEQAELFAALCREHGLHDVSVERHRLDQDEALVVRAVC